MTVGILWAILTTVLDLNSSRIIFCRTASVWASTDAVASSRNKIWLFQERSAQTKQLPLPNTPILTIVNNCLSKPHHQHQPVMLYDTVLQKMTKNQLWVCLRKKIPPETSSKPPIIAYRNLCKGKRSIKIWKFLLYNFWKKWEIPLPFKFTTRKCLL